MTLQFEKKVVCDKLWCIPRMSDLDWLVDTIFELSEESIVLQVVDCLELQKDYYVRKDVEKQTLPSE